MGRTVTRFAFSSIKRDMNVPFFGTTVGTQWLTRISRDIHVPFWVAGPWLRASLPLFRMAWRLRFRRAIGTERWLESIEAAGVGGKKCRREGGRANFGEAVVVDGSKVRTALSGPQHPPRSSRGASPAALKNASCSAIFASFSRSSSGALSAGWDQIYIFCFMLPEV